MLVLQPRRWSVFAAVFLQLLMPSFHQHVAGAETLIGCLFSPSICAPKKEWCYDDSAFGRCLSVDGKLTAGDMVQYSLEPQDLSVLEDEMQRLYSLGFRWDQLYTQCVLQALLKRIAEGSKAPFDRGGCDETFPDDIKTLSFMDPVVGTIEDNSVIDTDDGIYVTEDDIQRMIKMNPDAAVAVDENGDVVVVADDGTDTESDTNIDTAANGNNNNNDGISEREANARLLSSLLEDPRYLASVRFTPSALNPHSGFADEVYSPPEETLAAMAAAAKVAAGQHQERHSVDAMLPMNLLRQELMAEAGKINPSEVSMKDLAALASAAAAAALQDPSASDPSPENVYKNKVRVSKRVLGIDKSRNKKRSKGNGKAENVSKDEERRGGISASFEDDLNYFDDYDNAELTRDRKGGSDAPKSYNYFRDILLMPYMGHNGDSSGAIDLAALWQSRKLTEEDEDEDSMGEEDVSSDFSGKDMVSPLDDDGDFEMLSPFAQKPVSLEDGPYQRLERMDVKKPGPEFDLSIPLEPPKHGKHHNHHQVIHHQVHVHDDDHNDLQVSPSAKHNMLFQDIQNDDHQFARPSGKQEILNKLPPPVKPKNQLFRKDWGFLQITRPFADILEGRRLVASLERLLRLEPGTFTEARVENNQVMFKVNPNPQRMNVTDIIIGADKFQEAIKNDVGVELESGGIGDEIKITWKDYLPTAQERLTFMGLCLAASTVALMTTGFILYALRRRCQSNDKLHFSRNGDHEASRDYQDLCRARMATKAQEKPEPLHKIITGCIRDDGTGGQSHQGVTGSPHSSRSSTSSWTEEPVASNMDISTGHMVLSYMEDHLKNKDKLEQEWLALCAYEADPSFTTVADKTENKKKNRDKVAVPYDHARVILNDLSNISGSDYINASTITDHDPRNPAYIACQGPMAGTAADFWQMVWEQGSVVIVMLTKLAENGHSMCHRYWPEEGSEVYHIYEVHLVSEHIWCEDYLVRSFYLKNLKTGETRTVTQFHFLSWPLDGVPGSTRALLEFRRKVNKSYRGRSCPIIVHCNDGSGRTGTYCLIDMVLNRMGKGAKEIDIAATLEHIRDQRPGTVKTRGQFEFVLMAVAEEVHAILKAMPQ